MIYQQRWDIHHGFEMCIGCWCDKLSQYNAMIFISPTSQRISVCVIKVYQSLSDFVSFTFLFNLMCSTGFPKVEEHHSERTEAEVGQDITLPCIFNNIPDLKIANVEWRKENIKVALYDLSHGIHLFWPNVTIETVKNKENNFMGTYLHLPAVNEGDSGIYICTIATFPYGNLRKEMELKIKGMSSACKVALALPRL